MNPVWQSIATFILRSRIPILMVVGLITAFMWVNRGTEIAQTISSAILTEGDIRKAYEQFRDIFGDDANVMVTSVSGDIFSYEMFADLYDLTEELEQLEGVEGVISLTRLYDVVRDDSIEGFSLQPLLFGKPQNQAEVDSIADRIRNLPFYQGLLLDDSMRTTLVAVSFNSAMLDTDKKVDLVRSVRDPFYRFGEKHKLEPHFAGMPVIRVNMHETVKSELVLFLALALIVTAITLLVFFRSLYNVLFPMIVVASVIVFSLGLIGLLGYKMTLVTGIIPALITVISIPNSVYLITKYHIEYRRTQNKVKSLVLVVEKIGIVTVMTNATTAIGLGVLSFTSIQYLREFGIVAGLSVVAAFFISLFLIPIFFSFLPPPTTNQTAHLDRRGLSFVIRSLKKVVQNHRGIVYVITATLFGLSLYGMSQVIPVAFIVDDMPEESKILKDLRFIEDRFNGALPFEIMIDTKSRRGALRRRNLQKIEKLQQELTKYQSLSKSISVADFAKFFNQSFFGGDPDFYELPSSQTTPIIGDYARNTKFFGELSLSKMLTDSLFQITRVSASLKDIGSLEMEKLVDSVRADVDKIFSPERYEVHITGTPQIFIKNNDALIENLLKSLLIAFVVIAIIMGLLFRSMRMVLISLVPNLLPLIMVAGIMGFAGIALKPSTALVFGVAFGIAVDDSIHFLARYRLARKTGDTVKQAVSNSFDDTGVSMIYTSIILFGGFVCFTASEFGGTKALGFLTSLTLGIAMFSNLVFLPALLLTFDKEDASTDKGSDENLEPAIDHPQS
ncbi:MAG: efflux RND transporter permease subunit [Bacteroidota bacterium]